MSKADAVHHGSFGRATLYMLDRPIKPHAHREGHLIFHLGGPSSWARTSRGTVFLDAETAAAVNPWEQHEFVPSEFGRGSKYLVLYISQAWFAEAGRRSEAPLRFGQAELHCTPRILLLVATLHRALSGIGPRHCLDTLIYDLALESFEQSWGGRSVAAADPVTAPALDYRIRKSMRLISDRLGSEIEFDNIAREAGLSRPNFYRHFRRQIGITPHVYLCTLRMERATTILTTTARTVTDIGLSLGFGSHSGFTRFFAQHVGVPPDQYRRAATVLSQ